MPVVPVSLDFAKKELRFHAEVDIGSDIESELERFKDIYADICAKNPQAV